MLVRYNKTLARATCTFDKGYQKANSLYNKLLDFNKFSISLSRKLINCIIFLCICNLTSVQYNKHRFTALYHNIFTEQFTVR